MIPSESGEEARSVPGKVLAKQLLGLIVHDSFQSVMVAIPWRSLFALKTKVGDSDPEIISGIWWGYPHSEFIPGICSGSSA